MEHLEALFQNPGSMDFPAELVGRAFHTRPHTRSTGRRTDIWNCTLSTGICNAEKHPPHARLGNRPLFMIGAFKDGAGNSDREDNKVCVIRWQGSGVLLSNAYGLARQSQP